MKEEGKAELKTLLSKFQKSWDLKLFSMMRENRKHLRNIDKSIKAFYNHLGFVMPRMHYMANPAETFNLCLEICEVDNSRDIELQEYLNSYRDFQGGKKADYAWPESNTSSRMIEIKNLLNRNILQVIWGKCTETVLNSLSETDWYLIWDTFSVGVDSEFMVFRQQLHFLEFQEYIHSKDPELLNESLNPNRANESSLDILFPIAHHTHIDQHLNQLQYLKLFMFCEEFLDTKLNLVEEIRELFVYANWLMMFNEEVILCPYPDYFLFREREFYSVNSKPSIVYESCSFSVYVNNGVWIPRKYGSLPPEEWKIDWIFDEKNLTLRSILLRGIGYQRVVDESEHQVIDIWKGYQLLRINRGSDIQPLQFLRMRDYSTENEYILRVPPDICSAREAIRWINWGIDPEDFELET